jgi:transcriptional regulator with XRE-family HTH domain
MIGGSNHMTTIEAIKATREKAGESQQTFSNHLGVTVTTVSRWETGRVTPDPQMLVRLANLAEERGLYEIATALNTAVIQRLGMSALNTVMVVEARLWQAGESLRRLAADYDIRENGNYDACARAIQEALASIRKNNPFEGTTGVLIQETAPRETR